MKFDGVKKVDEGRFISRYDLYYTTEDDKKKVYEIISRNKDIKTLEDIRNEMYKNSISTFDNYSLYIYPVYSYNFLGET